MPDSGFEILIADDDPVVRAQLHALLTRYGYPSTVVEDGHEAWELVAKRHFPICITDWSMPVLSGLELCRRIRRRGDAYYTYIILITGRNEPDAVSQGLEAGADDFVVKPLDSRELLARLRVARRILTLQRSMRQTERQLRMMAEIDGLTGLLNRRALNEAFVEERRRLGRHHEWIAVMMIDVDHFKKVNDDYGHQAGDVVLREVAARVHSLVREGDLVGRYGGEELIVVLVGPRPEEASLISERIRASVERDLIQTPRGPIQVTISAGLVVADHNYRGTTPELVEAADRALYRAKNSGRNRVCEEPIRCSVADPPSSPEAPVDAGRHESAAAAG